ncbi:unnamed protein product [Allacma fusca]|uniref:Protein amnionless n=1 Tax=Allacma fusca TaxID=39272 RepID=A0A8J2PHT9_9HEXA|nr:unnamed protein product [Allacma fusca]
MSGIRKLYNCTFLTCAGLFLLLLLLLIDSSSGAQGRVKEWKRNMNFDNAENWEGLVDKSCGANIFSFDAWMESSVISLPTHISAKQIILPLNGYFVFQPGLTTLSTSTTCQPKEAKFIRKGPLDWYNPDNWSDSKEPNNKAIGHVERVPCQYDSVTFKANSSFSIRISADVTIQNFFLGNESLSYAEVGLLMSEALARIQFQKESDSVFQIETPECLGDESCVCSNYQDSMRKHICDRADCRDGVNEDTCTSPITPHGFCCPICGFHIKIKHKDGFPIDELKSKLKRELKPLKGAVNGYATRFNVDSHVIDVSVEKSWEELDDSGTLASQGATGTVVSLIVLLIIVLLGGAAILIFYWRRSGYPIGTFWGSCPSFRWPTWLPSTTTAPSFAFARFANERISHLNLGAAFEGSMARAEAVDSEIQSGKVETVVPTSEAVSVGFSNDIYDVVADEEVAVKPGDMSMVQSKPHVEPEHVYDLIEVSDGTSSILGGSTTELINTTEE